MAIAAAEKIQARLVLGDLSLLEKSKPQEITLQVYGQQWLAADVALRLKPATVEKYRGSPPQALAARALPLSDLDAVTQTGRLAVSQASYPPSHLRVDADPRG